jgi:S-(hydroxymethyl)glutathione dehydrogenase / alcohol dehydrogenase
VIGDGQILRDFLRFIKLAESGKLDLGSLVTNRIKLEEINDGLAGLNGAEGVRTVVLGG